MKTIIIVGPVLSQTGYGEQCRFALRSLLAYPERFDVYLKPIHWGQSSCLLPNDPDREWIDPIIQKSMAWFQAPEGQRPPMELSLQVTIPNEWEKLTPINIGYTAGIETTKVAPGWIEKSKLMDKIITISNHSRDVFLQTVYDATVEETQQKIEYRCDTPIDVVHYPVREYGSVDLEIELENDFNYLVISQWGPRKNLENTIRWWVEEFKDNNVGLVVKTNLIKTSIVDREFTRARLQQLLENYPDRKCKVYLIHGNMKPSEISSLYSHPKIKCIVSLTHGEGFGLPLFEAAYNGLPVIAPDWSGHKDFLYAPITTKSKGKKVTKIKNCFLKVDYTLKPIQPEAVWDGVVSADSQWCFADEKSYKKQLRNMLVQYDRRKHLAQKLQKYLVSTFTPETQYEQFAEAVWKEETFEIEDWLKELETQVHE
jgi:glycosyltransferase involved in cell wall biosynthesis